MNELAPVILFAYNRPGHTRRTLEALSKNDWADRTKLFVYIDYPRDGNHTANNAAVKSLVRSRKWCGNVEIVERSENYGLARNIVEGISEVIGSHRKIIVLEDDIVTSVGFLRFMNDALNVYQNEKKVMHLAGYLPETRYPELQEQTFFVRFMSCWGWATWADRWEKLQLDSQTLLNELDRNNRREHFNLDGAINHVRHLEMNITGQLNTWAIKWAISIYLNEGLALYPSKSIVNNIGQDGSGMHKDNIPGSGNMQLADYVQVDRIDTVESEQGRLYLKNYYRFGFNSPA